MSKTLNDGHPLPKLFVFDLDFTLWPFWCDTHVAAPVKTGKSTNSVLDHSNEKWSFYRDVPCILLSLHLNPNTSIAAASRTHTPDLARKLLRCFKLPRDPTNTSPMSLLNADKADLVDAITLFDEMEIYPGEKTKHFTELQKSTDLSFEDMIFFDDEGRNRNVERKHGVHFVLVEDGVTWEVFDQGVKGWRKKWGHDGA